MFYGKKISNYPLISIIIDTYNRPKELKITIEHILSQTYNNLEIIIIDNASNEETKKYLKDLKKNKLFKFLIYQVNQFSFDDPQKMIKICCNDALKIASGELVFYLSDDDWVEKKFLSKIIIHFINNKKCTSAIGRVKSYYNENKIQNHELKSQPIYMSGKDICLDRALLFNKFDQSNPGHSYVFKTDVLKYYGGFFAPLEVHQFFGVVAFGETAFDKDAIMYWRRHEGQLNKLLNKKCYFEGQYILDLIQNKKNNILDNWNLYYGSKNAKIIEEYLNEIIIYSFYKTLFCLVFNLNLFNAFHFYNNKKKLIKKKYSSKVAYKGLKEAFLRSFFFRKYISIKNRLKMLFGNKK